MARQGIFMDPTLGPGRPSPNGNPAILTRNQREHRQIQPFVLEAHRRSIELGVEVAAGTDAGVGRKIFDLMPSELRILTEQLGLSPAQALRAATHNAARSASLEHDLGSLLPGRLVRT